MNHMRAKIHVETETNINFTLQDIEADYYSRINDDCLEENSFLGKLQLPEKWNITSGKPSEKIF